MRYELFSKRQKRAKRAGQPVLYQYDKVPEPLRYQVTRIWDRLAGQDNAYEFKKTYQRDLWEYIHNYLSEEHGKPYSSEDDSYFDSCVEYLLDASDIEALDIIEASFNIIIASQKDMDAAQRLAFRITSTVEDSITLINHRFREHDVGYQFEGGLLIRIDSQFVHSEVVKPALILLHDEQFEGAEEEFLQAHEHYRHGKNKEAIVAAGKAFESTLKTICDKRGWEITGMDTANKLVGVIRTRPAALVS